MFSPTKRRQSSGPIPAGSPEVTAITGRPHIALAVFKAYFDIRAVTLLAQPVLVSFVHFTIAQYLARSHPLAIRGSLLHAPLKHLNQVITEW